MTAARRVTVARWSRVVSTLFFGIAAASMLLAQEDGGPDEPNPFGTAEQDHRSMMSRLGIRTLRPGASRNEKARNHANYDEATANPFPTLPDVLTLKDGKLVTSADMWWKQRRPEIVEDFDREVLGRVPANAPKVTWAVTSQAKGIVGSRPVIAKQLAGRVDGSSRSHFPTTFTRIRMTLVTPADTTGPVPVMMMFGDVGGLPRATPAPARTGGGARAAGLDQPATVQLVAAG